MTPHLGVCYYPEFRSPDQVKTDLRRMRDLGLSIVRMGEGAWWYWNPRPGVFQFELFDAAVAECERLGLRVFLGTPTYAAPAWVARAYPDVLRAFPDRSPMHHGSRRVYNYTSANYLRLCDELVAQLARHYAGVKSVVGWQIDNEFNCHSDRSFTESDTRAFQQWLADKYHTLEALNDAWGTRFWSQVYDAWDQIDLPGPTAAPANPHQLLDEKRFISDGAVRFCRRQAAILRSVNRDWEIFHNGLFANISGPDLRAAIDTFAQDQYPSYSAAWQERSLNLQTARSLSFPYTVMEQQVNAIGQVDYLLPTPTAAEIELWAWQAIAHGADRVLFFPWQSNGFGAEQLCRGLIEADEQESESADAVRRLIAAFKELPEGFVNDRPVRQLAVLRDFDNEADQLQISRFAGQDRLEYQAWTTAASTLHLPVDMVWPGGDWTGYGAIVLPRLRMIDAALLSKLGEFANQGGWIIATAQTAVMDRRMHLNPALHQRFCELAGMRVKQWTTLRAPTDEAHTFRETVELTTAERLTPTLTRRRLGKGGMIYASVGVQQSIAEAILKQLPTLQASIQSSDQVEIVRRGKSVCLLNHSPSPQTAIITGQSFALPPLSMRVVPFNAEAPRHRE